MADFYQTGCVTALHRLKPGSAARMENELRAMADRVSIALVLPTLYSEFESPAMRRIADELANVPFLRRLSSLWAMPAQMSIERSRSSSRTSLRTLRCFGWIVPRCRVFWESSRNGACQPVPTGRGGHAGSPMAIFSLRAIAT